MSRVTPAMRRALDLLADGPARYSNYTGRGMSNHEGKELGRAVYWQSADQLAAAGLVTFSPYEGELAGRMVTLTEAGRMWLDDVAGAR